MPQHRCYLAELCVGHNVIRPYLIGALATLSLKTIIKCEKQTCRLACPSEVSEQHYVVVFSRSFIAQLSSSVFGASSWFRALLQN